MDSCTVLDGQLGKAEGRNGSTKIKTWLKDKEQEQGMGDRHTPFWRTVISHIVECPIESATILDFGCNTGGFLRLLHSRLPFAKGYGVDIAQDSIDQAIALCGDLPITYRATSDLGFLPDKIDIAFSYEVIFLLPDLLFHAKQISDALKKGGVYYAATGCHTGNPLWAQWVPLVKADSAIIPNDYTLDDFANAFASVGFEVSAKRLHHQEFVRCMVHPEYFPTIESSIDYYDRDITLFRFSKT